MVSVSKNRRFSAIFYRNPVIHAEMFNILFFMNQSYKYNSFKLRIYCTNFKIYKRF